MREYRGEGIASGNWYFGYYTIYDGQPCIQENNGQLIAVVAQTVGQFIGRKDITGEKIYEGDILEVEFAYIWGDLFKREGVVKYSETDLKYYIDIYDNYFYKIGFDNEVVRLKRVKVVGNIINNPELLKERH